MGVSQATYERVALEDNEGQWELVCGQLRRKPAMTMAHNDIQHVLAFAVARELDDERFTVRINSTRLRTPGGDNFVPDVVVVPLAVLEQLLHSSALEGYSEPMPLVVEVWSPSTGEYDVETKLPQYRARGDLEIWLVHPQRREITAWRRQANGDCSETLYTRGDVPVLSLPGVKVKLETLFRFP
jgi:Uma2 family endonuclease